MRQIDLTNYGFDLYVLKKLVTSLLNPTLSNIPCEFDYLKTFVRNLLHSPFDKERIREIFSKLYNIRFISSIDIIHLKTLTNGSIR